MAMACSAVRSYGISSRLATSELSTVPSLPLSLRATASSGISRRLECSLERVRVERVSHRASARRSNEVATDSRTEKESGQVQESGPTFRFMAEGNMWLLEFEASGLRVLADPWLVDNQTFWDQAWLYTGRSESRQRGGFPGDLTMEYVNSVDAILISQEWEDHCHLPTLKLLRKDIPVFASPKAATIVQQLGFTDVRNVAHGTSSQIPGLQVWATVGGRVGPPWALRENGFVLQDMQSGIRIYYEPHCSFDEKSVRSVSPVDVVITPGRQYKVAGLPLTESVEEAVCLLRILKPQLVLPVQLTHLEIAGVTAPIIQFIGSVNDFEADLRKAGINARVVAPPLSGHFMHVELGSQKPEGTRGGVDIDVHEALDAVLDMIVGPMVDKALEDEFLDDEEETIPTNPNTVVPEGNVRFPVGDIGGGSEDILYEFYDNLQREDVMRKDSNDPYDFEEYLKRPTTNFEKGHKQLEGRDEHVKRGNNALQMEEDDFLEGANVLERGESSERMEQDFYNNDNKYDIDTSNSVRMDNDMEGGDSGMGGRNAALHKENNDMEMDDEDMDR